MIYTHMWAAYDTINEEFTVLGLTEENKVVSLARGYQTYEDAVHSILAIAYRLKKGWPV